MINTRISSRLSPIENHTYFRELTWDDVQLPPSVVEQQLDEIIFSVMKPTWRKTAMMVSNVMDRCEELELPIEGDVIAARLKVLSDSERIEGIGDIQSWFRSEVRLKDYSACDIWALLSPSALRGALATKQSRLATRKDSGLLRCARNDECAVTTAHPPG